MELLGIGGWPYTRLNEFCITQNISYDIKLSVNLPDTAYDELNISQRCIEKYWV